MSIAVSYAKPAKTSANEADDAISAKYRETMRQLSTRQEELIRSYRERRTDSAG